MPTGYSKIGNSDMYGRSDKSGPEVLGTIPDSSRITDPQPKSSTTTWTREDGTVIELSEPAPPWEQHDDKFSTSDARRFVEVPPQWRLHWVNPRLLDSEGWRDWQPVMASDTRVSVRVHTMVSPEGYIRRGGPTGDILAWMWQGWHESVKKKMREKTAAQTQSAVDQQRKLKEDFARGEYGPYLRVEGATHPSHTMAEGRTMQDT